MYMYLQKAWAQLQLPLHNYMYTFPVMFVGLNPWYPYHGSYQKRGQSTAEFPALATATRPEALQLITQVDGEKPKTGEYAWKRKQSWSYDALNAGYNYGLHNIVHSKESLWLNPKHIQYWCFQQSLVNLKSLAPRISKNWP